MAPGRGSGSGLAERPAGTGGGPLELRSTAEPIERLAFTPPEHEDGLRCHFDAGNYQMAVETTIQGHRAVQYWVMKPTYHNSFWCYSCIVAYKTSYGVLQQALYFSTVYSNPTNLQRANDLAPYYKF